eukprot:RCo046652
MHHKVGWDQHVVHVVVLRRGLQCGPRGHRTLLGALAARRQKNPALLHHSKRLVNASEEAELELLPGIRRRHIRELALSGHPGPQGIVEVHHDALDSPVAPPHNVLVHVFLDQQLYTVVVSRVSERPLPRCRAGGQPTGKLDRPVVKEWRNHVVHEHVLAVRGEDVLLVDEPGVGQPSDLIAEVVVELLHEPAGVVLRHKGPRPVRRGEGGGDALNQQQRLRGCKARSLLDIMGNPLLGGLTTFAALGRGVGDIQHTLQDVRSAQLKHHQVGLHSGLLELCHAVNPVHLEIHVKPTGLRDLVEVLLRDRCEAAAQHNHGDLGEGAGILRAGASLKGVVEVH